MSLFACGIIRRGHECFSRQSRGKHEFIGAINSTKYTSYRVEVGLEHD